MHSAREVARCAGLLSVLQAWSGCGLMWLAGSCWVPGGVCRAAHERRCRLDFYEVLWKAEYWFFFCFQGCRRNIWEPRNFVMLEKRRGCDLIICLDMIHAILNRETILKKRPDVFIIFLPIGRCKKARFQLNGGNVSSHARFREVIIIIVKIYHSNSRRQRGCDLLDAVFFVNVITRVKWVKISQTPRFFTRPRRYSTSFHHSV